MQWCNLGLMQTVQCECGEIFVVKIHAKARIVNQWNEALHQSEHEQWYVEAMFKGLAYQPSHTPKDHSEAPRVGHMSGVCFAHRATIMTVPTVTFHKRPRHHSSMRKLCCCKNHRSRTSPT